MSRFPHEVKYVHTETAAERSKFCLLQAVVAFLSPINMSAGWRQFMQARKKAVDTRRKAIDAIAGLNLRTVRASRYVSVTRPAIMRYMHLGTVLQACWATSTYLRTCTGTLRRSGTL